MSKGLISWNDALEAMQSGKIVRNDFFTREEFFEMRDGRIYAEDGCSMHGWYRGEDWQKTGWSIIPDPRSK